MSFHSRIGCRRTFLVLCLTLLRVPFLDASSSFVREELTHEQELHTHHFSHGQQKSHQRQEQATDEKSTSENPSYEQPPSTSPFLTDAPSSSNKPSTDIFTWSVRPSFYASKSHFPSMPTVISTVTTTFGSITVAAMETPSASPRASVTTDDLFATMAPMSQPSVSPSESYSPTKLQKPSVPVTPTKRPVKPPTPIFPTYSPTEGTNLPTLTPVTYTPTYEIFTPTDSPSTSSHPSSAPTLFPTISSKPTALYHPSSSPTTTNVPSDSPILPATSLPSLSPTLSSQPTEKIRPSASPTLSTMPSPAPSHSKSSTPSLSPTTTSQPTEKIRPSASPTVSTMPSPAPSHSKSFLPSRGPTISSQPTKNMLPSASPNVSNMPSQKPNSEPISSSPTSSPTRYVGEPSSTVAGQSSEVSTFGCDASSPPANLILDGTTQPFECNQNLLRKSTINNAVEQGFFVTPTNKNPSIVDKIRVYAGSDCSGCDAVEYKIEGYSNRKWVLISTGNLRWQNGTATNPVNSTIQNSNYDHGDLSLVFTEETFNNSRAFRDYRLTFPRTRDGNSKLIVAEVELPGRLFENKPTEQPTSSPTKNPQTQNPSRIDTSSSSKAGKNPKSTKAVSSNSPLAKSSKLSHSPTTDGFAPFYHAKSRKPAMKTNTSPIHGRYPPKYNDDSIRKTSKPTIKQGRFGPTNMNNNLLGKSPITKPTPPPNDTISIGKSSKPTIKKENSSGTSTLNPSNKNDNSFGKSNKPSIKRDNSPNSGRFAPHNNDNFVGKSSKPTIKKDNSSMKGDNSFGKSIKPTMKNSVSRFGPQSNDISTKKSSKPTEKEENRSNNHRSGPHSIVNINQTLKKPIDVPSYADKFRFQDDRYFNGKLNSTNMIQTSSSGSVRLRPHNYTYSKVIV